MLAIAIGAPAALAILRAPLTLRLIEHLAIDRCPDTGGYGYAEQRRETSQQSAPRDDSHSELRRPD